MDTLREKKKKLDDYLTGLRSVAVAFSSGVDLTFLLKTAQDESIVIPVASLDSMRNKFTTWKGPTE